MLSLTLLLVLVLLLLLCFFCCCFFVVFFVLFFVVVVSSFLALVITSLGEEKAGLYASREFVCLFYMRFFFSSSWCPGSDADCDCGTPLTFHPKAFCSEQTYLGFVPVWRTTHLLTLN